MSLASKQLLCSYARNMLNFIYGTSISKQFQKWMAGAIKRPEGEIWDNEAAMEFWYSRRGR